MTSQDEKTDTAAEKTGTLANKVHSANNWETVDLGDDERKNKFLRLMGASSKKPHLGRFVIGDTDSEHMHAREKKETDDLTKELEDQFVHSQEHKITKWSHHGLGFSKDEPKTVGDSESTTSDAKPEDVGGSATTTETSASAEKIDNESEEKSERKRESVDEPAPEEVSNPKKPKMMMSFVKASD